MEKKLDKDFILNHKAAICLAAFVIFSAVVILVSHIALTIPIVTVCIFVILEALLCACLNRIPIWVHVLVAVAQIVAGIMADRSVFMILMALVYVGCIVFLNLWARDSGMR